jgi:hypothetical protein
MQGQAAKVGWTEEYMVRVGSLEGCMSSQRGASLWSSKRSDVTQIHVTGGTCHQSHADRGRATEESTDTQRSMSQTQQFRATHSQHACHNLDLR